MFPLLKTTKLFLSFKVGDADEAKDTIQKDLHLISNWCFDNCLLLNPEKTKLMIFGSCPMIRRLSDYTHIVGVLVQRSRTVQAQAQLLI